MFATQKGKNIVSKNYMTWTYPLQFCILCHTCSTVYNASKWRHILLSTTVFPKVGFLIGICHIEPFMKTWMDSSSSSIDLAETKTAPLIFCRATQNCEMKIGVVNVMGIQSGTWRWKSPRWWTGTLPTAWNRFVTCPNIAQQCCMTMLKYAQVPQVRFQIFSGLSEASGDAQNVMTTCKFYVSAWPTHHLRGTPLNAHTNTRLVQLGVLRRLWRSIHCFLMNRKNVKSSSSSSPPSSPPPPPPSSSSSASSLKIQSEIENSTSQMSTLSPNTGSCKYQVHSAVAVYSSMAETGQSSAFTESHQKFQKAQQLV